MTETGTDGDKTEMERPCETTHMDRQRDSEGRLEGKGPPLMHAVPTDQAPMNRRRQKCRPRGRRPRELLQRPAAAAGGGGGGVRRQPGGVKEPPPPSTS